MPAPVNDDKFCFESNEDAREKMKRYIVENFSELLGDDIKLLNLPNGLNILSEIVRERLEKSVRRAA